MGLIVSNNEERYKSLTVIDNSSIMSRRLRGLVACGGKFVLHSLRLS